MPDPITCPTCGNEAEPAARVDGVVVCGSCGASLVVSDDAPVRRATAAETTALSPEALQTLRAARGRVLRPERRSA